MGSNLSFVAFRNEPNIEAINRLGWIKAYCLYRRRGRAEWYLQGPDNGAGEPTLWIPLRTSWSWRFSGQAAVAKEVTRLRGSVNAVSDDTEALDHVILMQALQLSADLKMQVLAGFGDDEGMDGGIVCAAGKIVGGRMLTEGSQQLTLDGAGIRAQASIEKPRLLHRILGDVATEFFGHSEPAGVSYDPFDFDAEDYERVAARG